MGVDESLYEKIESCIAEGRFPDARAAVKEAQDSGADAAVILSYHIIPPIKRLVEQFDEGKVYLPTIVAASNFLEEFTSGMDVEELKHAPNVAIGTVSSDIHEIGKNICGAMLRVNGYRVTDLGSDVPAEKFISVANKERCFIIAASAAMKGGLKSQKELAEMAKDSDIMILVGGASCNERWAESIGAGYSKDAAELVRKVDCRVMDSD